MHKFFKANEIGAQRDFGSPAAAAAFAKRFIGRDAVCAWAGDDIIWFNPADQAEASAAVGASLEVVSSVATQRAAVKAKKEAAQSAHNEWALNKAGPDARRVSHIKFGAGTVISEDDKAVTVLFDNQKAPKRMVASMLVAA